MDSDVIVEVNKKMHDFQKAKLEKTPFKWLVRMAEPISISCPLLRELVNRWLNSYELSMVLVVLALLLNVKEFVGCGVRNCNTITHLS